jgi:hypothetical protein
VYTPPWEWAFFRNRRPRLRTRGITRPAPTLIQPRRPIHMRIAASDGLRRFRRNIRTTKQVPIGVVTETPHAAWLASQPLQARRIGRGTGFSPLE